MSYLYETHLHTMYGSACAVSRGRDYIRGYKKLGYTGIMVTEHFFNGNSALDSGLPWKIWVDRFCRGYEEAKAEGDRLGLDVFFGWEETFEGDDYLVYGLDKAWLLLHPEACRWTRLEQFEAVRAAGGCVVQAHPFRVRPYIWKIHLSPYCVDAVEVANAGNNPEDDALAKRYAENSNLPVTAGSDIHNASDLVNAETFGVYLDRRLTCIGDYVAVIRSGHIAGLHISPGRCDFRGSERIALPVEIRDKRDRPTDIYAHPIV
jgi:hypothetical protein